MTIVPETDRHPRPAREHSSARQTLSRTRDLLDPALRDWVGRLPSAVARVASYHFGWTDSTGRPDSAPAGKALRPALVLTCAEAVGGAAEEVLAPAVAVELVHNFSLLHDDILDRDAARRHRPTAWTVFGSSSALLAGDALLNHASRVLSEEAWPRTGTGLRWLSEAVARLIEGEHTDLSFEGRSHVTLAECLVMVERKTAALLSCSCALGALWGGGSPEQIEALRRFGTHLGIAFQLSDDMLGIWGDPAVTGKPAGADLVYRKKSLPVVAALESGTAAGRRLAELYLPPRERPSGREPAAALGERRGSASRAGGAATAEEVATLSELVIEAGGRAWAERTAAEQLRAALGCLRAADAVEPAAGRLADLARLACRRSS